MEKRKETLRSKRVCRFCLTDDEPLTSIFDRSIRGKNPVPLALQIMACVAIEVFPSDGMPGTICQMCRYFMDQSYRFKQICKQGDEALRHYVSQGDLRPPIPWPKDMIQQVPESVLGGKLPQVTSARDDFDDEDDEEMEIEVPPKQMIKVEPQEQMTPRSRGRPRKTPKPGSEPKSSTTTVVVTAQEDGTLYSVTQDDQEEETEGESTLYEADGDVASPAAEVPTNVFPCTDCERSFPLKQLLEIHMQNHKRERTHPCQMCERSFFSKYDLQKHESVHSGLKPFECIICQRSFARLTLLRRHEKVHTSVPKLLCTECDMVFLSVKELDAHHKKRHSVDKPFRCVHCPKRFAFKQGLDRHAITHSNQRPYKCHYCPQSFTSSIRLTKHVQSHAGNRPYICKFCPKAFLLSHHYTRHLRTKHMPGSEIGKKRTAQSTSEHYKCAQCNVIFQKQDDLIFHSAVHATQDLTCPLCKEIFQDVDDVVVHIKSHIEGEQYMCEWCDLVFMCEEKLDLHIDAEHREAAEEDPFKEISYLEGRLVDESELLNMNQSFEGEDRTGEGEGEGEDEEDDEFYENPSREENEHMADEEEDEEFVHEEEEDEDLMESKLNVKFVEESAVQSSSPAPIVMDIPLIANDPQPVPVDSPVLLPIPDEEGKPTYIELKTVQPVVQPVTVPVMKKPLEVMPPTTKSSGILQKAEEVKAQRRLAEELKEKHRVSMKALDTAIKSPIIIQDCVVLNAKPNDVEAKKIVAVEVPEKKVEKAPAIKERTPIKERTLVKEKTPIKEKSPVKADTPTKSPKGSQPIANSGRSSPLPSITSNIEIISPKTSVLKKVMVMKKPGAASSTGSSPKMSSEGQKKAGKTPEKEKPPQRSGEKSLQLLERDIMELKKAAKSGNDREREREREKQSSSSNQHRFLQRKSSLSPPKRDANKNFSFKTPTSIKKVTIREPERAEKTERKSSEERTPTKMARVTGPFPIPVKPLASSSKAKEAKEVKEIKEEAPSPEVKEPNSPPRRSRRPSKIKDYAAMIRDRTGLDSEDEDSEDEDEGCDEDPDEDGRHFEAQEKKSHAAPSASSTPLTGKKRGRPRKTPLPDTPGAAVTPVAAPPVTPSATPKTVKRPLDTSTPGSSKDGTSGGEPVVKRGRGRPKKVKEEVEPEEGTPTPAPATKDKSTTPKPKSTIQNYFQPSKATSPIVEPPEEASPKAASPKAIPPKAAPSTAAPPKADTPKVDAPKEDTSKTPIKIQKIEGVVQSVTNSGQTVLMSPTGQTLKKVPAGMTLPPGVRPLQLPRAPQVTEMKIGPRTVRVQKILMTKAEVEAMTKQGLVHIKDGAMVLKPGVKLPTSSSLKLMQANSLATSATISKAPAMPTSASKPIADNAKPSQDTQSAKYSNEMEEEEEEDETLIKFKSKPVVEADTSDNTSQSSEDLDTMEEKE